MTMLLLIRHGENNYTKTGRLAGWTPGVSLNEAGQQQAAALAERLKGAPIKAIYSSPLERARETAAPLAAAQRLGVQIVAGVGEVRYGQWQGRSLKAVARTKLWRTVQSLPSAMQFPEGETFRAVQTRAVEAVEQLVRAHPKDMIAVVSHGDVIKLLVAHYLGLPLDLFQRIMINTASVTVLRLGQGQPHLVKLNDTGRLELPPGKRRPAQRR
ncbi:MAG: MSMEG_4193 family putative phosphomutase [Anaerolineales bacterium]|nr:MSMEG_4193 family putative phosphomutase [Anaerolineales bacterium]